MATQTQTWIERFTETRAAWLAAKDALDHDYEAAVKVEYARLRAADKAAGRDTSGKSVQNRRTAAYDLVMMRDEWRARRDEVDALYAAHRAAADNTPVQS